MMCDANFYQALLFATTPAQAIGVAAEQASARDMLDTEPGELERQPMDTLGNLVDKLATANAKLWHTQEGLYAIRKMTPEEFEAAYGKDMKGLHKIVARCCDLNVQRAKLMDEIDKFLAETTGNQSVVREQHKIY